VTTASSPPPEPLLDLQRLMVAMRRRRRAWLSAGLLGLLAGMLLAVLLPAQPTAVTRLLIVHEGDQGAPPGSLIKTDIALLKTTRIAGAALKRINADSRPEDFVEDYQATALTNNVLELKVKGSDDADAVARAKAVADAFIADHVQRVQAAAAADAQALIDRRAKAEEELAKVDASIEAMSAADRRNRPADLQALYASRGELTSQISDLTNRAEDAGIGAPRVAAGTQIVDAPRALPRSFLHTAVMNAGIGFVLALAAGLALAAVTSVVRDRPVLRREIAEHLGASVIAQLREPRGAPARLWLPSRWAGRRRRVAATLARTVRGGQGAVSLLELGTQRTAAALALDMANALSADGPVVIVDDLPRGRLGSRLGATDRPIRVVDGNELSADRPGPAGEAELQIGVGSVRAGTAWTDLPRLGAETLLVVRAGHANTLWLHTVARQLADLQIPVIGVVLVDPDRKDRSDGTLWDGLHTALRGRARSTPAASPATPAPRAGAGASPRSATPAHAAQERAAGSATNGAAVATPYSDDYPTEVLGPIWPTPEDVEELVDVPSRRRHRLG